MDTPQCVIVYGDAYDAIPVFTWFAVNFAHLISGAVEMGVISYTNAIAVYPRSPSFSMVAVSGIQGLTIVAKPAIKTFQDLKGEEDRHLSSRYA
jgi:hypothetical protein